VTYARPGLVLGGLMAVIRLSLLTIIPIDTFGGGSAVIDYQGQIVGRHDYGGGSSWVAGTVEVEVLRKFRASAQWDNWIRDLATG
jgi:hypothetical protein